MINHPTLIVMLTYNDRTVKNAYEIFEQCKDSAACVWGMKEEALPLEQMKRTLCIYERMRKNNGFGSRCLY